MTATPTPSWKTAAIRRAPEVIAELIPLSGKRVVDVGCGDGTMCRFMAGQGAEVVGIESRESALARTQAQPPEAGETYRLGRAEALPFADASQDAVVFVNSLHHIPTEAQAEALAEARRVLVDGGVVLFTEPVADGPHFRLAQPIEDETEVRAHAYAAIRNAAAQGLAPERELFFRARIRFRDFEAFAEHNIAVDETRRARIDALEESLRIAFDALAEKEGSGEEEVYAFDQPMRVNLLRAV